ncbi:diaminopimelate epimerase [Flavobacterium sp. '19STA2R22 D10 B1']|uniref:diaminopimelate epimerase n=1 Tax=Flavobacterium aerium TaxID=3037261 RepID=UPI00278C6D8F|nr:diaminopimelate epimerase [Flavobacterium sp. '19STA2R22 D10 B1']
MNITFYKYQGTGNDFVMIDNREKVFSKNNTKWIAKICDRKYGVGADGLILLENHHEYDFKMVYYNADGKESTMCGNGGRCLVAFAKALGIIETETTFLAIDGLHYASINEDGVVSLQMKNVEKIKQLPEYVFLDTGSPHHIELVKNLENFDVKNEGATIRYGELYGATGSNVNFVEQIGSDNFAVRTYERGVEDETLSCGTGVTAVAIAMNAIGKTDSHQIKLDTEGGRLEVSFDCFEGRYFNIFLKGPATFVFIGMIEC